MNEAMTTDRPQVSTNRKFPKVPLCMPAAPDPALISGNDDSLHVGP